MIGTGGREAARRFDAIAVENGVPSLILMENAAFSLYIQAINLIEIKKCDRIVAFAGRGGNGGDAMALLRILHDRGSTLPLVLVPLFDDSNDLSGETLKNWEMLPVGIEVGEDDLSGNPLVIDGIMGTGLSRNLTDDLLAIIQKINHAALTVLAIDIPTGLDSNTGRPLPDALYATVTVSMGILKKGLFFNSGPLFAGRIVLGNISAPEESYEAVEYQVVEECDIVIPQVPLTSYKTKNGHALFILGDFDKVGAIILAARAFLRAGGGLATISLPDRESMISFAGRWPDLMLITDHDSLEKSEKWDVIVVGPGLSELRADVWKTVVSSSAKLIFDAGMFDLLNGDATLLEELTNRTIVFTPHLGELSRFMEREKSEEWFEAVDRFPLEKSYVLLAKNSASIVRFGSEKWIVPHGAAALSFGGTGDVLSGICAAFVHHLPLADAVLAAAMVHRKAGLLLEQHSSRHYHNVEFLIDLVGDAMKELL
ncbi:NAD(P)H-hydrate epimerase [bacterium]|nr:NAD(P)H-hydrate epimerase [bacterium]